MQCTRYALHSLLITPTAATTTASAAATAGGAKGSIIRFAMTANVSVEDAYEMQIGASSPERAAWDTNVEIEHLGKTHKLCSYTMLILYTNTPLGEGGGRTKFTMKV
jgi:hypothetical protein